MSDEQQPIVRHWYTDLAGRLFQVRAYVMGREGLEHVIIVYTSGERRRLGRHEWHCIAARRAGTRAARRERR